MFLKKGLMLYNSIYTFNFIIANGTKPKKLQTKESQNLVRARAKEDSKHMKRVGCDKLFWLHLLHFN
jgi:hypothetical protein